MSSGPKANGLRFDRAEDSLNFARQSVEESRRWLAARGLTVANRYEQGEFCLRTALYLSTESDSGKLKFLLRPVPSEITDLRRAREFSDHVVENEVGQIEVHVENELVFVGPGESVQRVKKVIPSTVWLEPFEDGNEADMDGATPLSDRLVNFSSVLRKGEIVTTLRSAEFDIGAVDRLVECVPEIVESIRRKHAKAARYFLSNAVLDDVLARLSVNLSDWDGEATVKESSGFRIKALYVVPSPIDE